MRILILTASLPYPPASGGALRSYGIIHGLAQAGHEITLLSFHDGSIAVEDTPLAEICAQVETVPPPQRSKGDRLRDLLLTNQPDIARRMYSPAMEKRLRDLLAKTHFDLIQFEAIETVCYLPIARQAQPAAKLCFDTFNAEYALQRLIFDVDRQQVKRWPLAAYSLIQSQRIKRFEGDMCRMADCVIAVSPEDAELLRIFRPDKQVFVVPNGIFVDDYAAHETIDLAKNALVFTGKMDYRPNVDAMLWFCDEILPQIEKQVSDVHLYIVGQKPHSRLDVLREHPNVILTGWVDSVKPYLGSTAVYIAPLRMGSGTRLKILEALAAGCAVVATSVAASGLQNQGDDSMVIADSTPDMAAAVIRLLNDPHEREQLAKNARAYVKANYDWPVLIPRLLAAFKETGIG